MAREKLPHELSIEDLLDSLGEMGEEIPIAQKELDKPVLSFIQAFNIVQGKEQVSDIVLYELFKMWHTEGAWTKLTFNLQLGKYLPSISKNRRYYLVDKNFLYIAQATQNYLRDRTKDKRKSLTWQKHFERFIEENGLDQGKSFFVEGDILFYIYNRWMDSINKIVTTSYITFLQVLELYFERKQVTLSDIKWFGVSRNIKKLITKEEVERWRAGRKKRNAKVKDEDKTFYQSRYIKATYRGIALYPEKVKKPKVGRPSRRSKNKIHTKKPG